MVRVTLDDLARRGTTLTPTRTVVARITPEERDAVVAELRALRRVEASLRPVGVIVNARGLAQLGIDLTSREAIATNEQMTDTGGLKPEFAEYVDVVYTLDDDALAALAAEETDA